MKKVLIVEDHADIRKLLHMTMEYEDFEIYEAANGDVGLEMARAHSPDVVLLDIMMPGTLSGLEVCRCIKATPALKHTKVIMLTARGQAEDRRDGIKAGADEYLIKPFSTIQVLETIYRLEIAHDRSHSDAFPF